MSLLEDGLRYYSRIAGSERGAYRLVRAVRHRLPTRMWVRTFTTPLGFDLTLDLAVYPDCMMAYGLYELSTARLIKRLIQPDDVFFDAGANLGYFTLLAAQQGARVHAVEPHPGNRARLEAHLAHNALTDHVTIHALALADQPGMLTLHPGTDNHGMASIFSAKRHAWHANEPHGMHGTDDAAGAFDVTRETGAVRVPAARASDMLPEAPALVKMDIEGAEHLAIEGMRPWLEAKSPPPIIGEFNPATATDADVEPEAWVTLAREIQPAYRVYRIGRRLTPVRSFKRLGQVNLLLTTQAM